MERIKSLPPCGGSGLKYDFEYDGIRLSESPSVWREWIEMSTVFSSVLLFSRLPPCGGSGLKYKVLELRAKCNLSPSVWREWIEM